MKQEIIGYTFYKYLKKEHPEINVKYVIRLDSPDAYKIDNEDIVQYRSKEHYILFLRAKYLISTHIMGFSPEFRLFTKIDKRNIVKYYGKKIFLQHGITKDKAMGLKKEFTNLDLFICGADTEYKYLKEILGYNDNEIKYTGFSRFDSLKNDIKEREILVMPTWRTNLFYSKSNNKFEESCYFKAWNGLLNNPEICELLNKYDTKLVFYPHYEMQKYIKYFTKKSDRIIIANKEENDVQKLLTSSSCLITDFSSVFFDFAYLEKPIIYYQFDYNDYRKNHYEEGYFSYEENGFGHVAYNLENLVKHLDDYLKSNFAVEEQYIDRKNEFFKYKDKKNSERIYKEIKRL